MGVTVPVRSTCVSPSGAPHRPRRSCRAARRASRKLAESASPGGRARSARAPNETPTSRPRARPGMTAGTQNKVRTCARRSALARTTKPPSSTQWTQENSLGGVEPADRDRRQIAGGLDRGRLLEAPAEQSSGLGWVVTTTILARRCRSGRRPPHHRYDAAVALRLADASRGLFDGQTRDVWGGTR
jgi:hypothetical protein